MRRVRPAPGVARGVCGMVRTVLDVWVIGRGMRVWDEGGCAHRANREREQLLRWVKRFRSLE